MIFCWSNFWNKYLSHSNFMHKALVKNLEHPIPRIFLGYLGTKQVLLYYAEVDTKRKLKKKKHIESEYLE